ncbi:MAG: carotenoid 1,2-hydratase [Candidatus Eremiobacteraeota bacterium]|nr:carotenoid 1,2-hydratase [Candidatus Eremiobacteraeota bacterium]
MAGGEGFSNPKPGRRFRFPEDHGPHDDFLSEWWYFTGNLEEFGYELTLFRQATEKPVDRLIPRTSAWASKHSMMGHFAISDVRSGKFHRFERLSRAAVGLAGATPRSVWVEDWKIDLSTSAFHVKAAAEGCMLDLSMKPLKAPVLQGEDGYSRKGDRPEQSSYYYSLTRLETQGVVQVPSGRHSVRGTSWMDREWSTQPLGKEMAGWDWFALQLDDGCELMFYQLRDKQGRSVQWSAGSWVSADGKVTRLKRDDLKLEVTGHWRSPVDGAEYPAGWKIGVQGRELVVKPRLSDQEMTGAVRYWEGAVEVSSGGRGYVEMVGYSR